MPTHPQATGATTPRIALICCYFGELPNYLPFVMRSVAHNPTIDWLIFGDCPPACPLPSNVRFHRCELMDIKIAIEKECNTPVLISTAYDLTQLKPSFGLCFKEHLKGYHFWGHVDLDMIYGNLRKFLPDEVMSAHDRIYVRGHLSLYRNTDEVNRHFMLMAPGAPSYKKVFIGKDHSQFDEWAGIWKIYRYHRIPQYHAEVIADIMPSTETRINRFEALELPNYPHQVFYWHQGATYQAYYHREGGLFDREVAYIHFQKRKFPLPSFDPESVNGFTIGPYGFAPYDRENLSPSEMDALNPNLRRPLLEIFKIKFARAVRKQRKIFARIAGNPNVSHP